MAWRWPGADGEREGGRAGGFAARQRTGGGGKEHKDSSPWKRMDGRRPGSEKPSGLLDCQSHFSTLRKKITDNQFFCAIDFSSNSDD